MPKPPLDVIIFPSLASEPVSQQGKLKNGQLRRSARQGRWVLVATILASSMAFIDGSALNVALDALQKDLHATGTELIWVDNA